MMELLVFSLLSGVVLISSVLVITVKDIFRAAILLAMMFLGMAGIFITLNAEFLAAVQILVYAGAVTIMMLFAIMLTRKKGVSR